MAKSKAEIICFFKTIVKKALSIQERTVKHSILKCQK